MHLFSLHKQKLFLTTIFSTLCYTSSLISAPNNLIEVKDKETLEQYMTSGKALLVEVYAEWCGVCKRAKPVVEALAQNNKNASFLLIQDTCKDIIKPYYDKQINGYPTFLFFNQQGKYVDTVAGLDQDKIKNALATISAKKSAAEEMQEIKMPEEKKEKALKMKEGLIEITSKQDFDMLVSKKKPFLLDFYTTWCGPCKMLKPELEALAQNSKYQDMIFASVDAESCKDIAQKYSLSCYPTIILFDKDGNIYRRFDGYHGKVALTNALDELVSGRRSVIIKEEAMQMSPCTKKASKRKK